MWPLLVCSTGPCVLKLLFRGNAFARRRRDRDMEIESDERDRMRERDELEELKLQVMWD